MRCPSLLLLLLLLLLLEVLTKVGGRQRGGIKTPTA